MQSGPHLSEAGVPAPWYLLSESPRELSGATAVKHWRGARTDLSSPGRRTLSRRSWKRRRVLLFTERLYVPHLAPATSICTVAHSEQQAGLGAALNSWALPSLLPAVWWPSPSLRGPWHSAPCPSTSEDFLICRGGSCACPPCGTHPFCNEQTGPWTMLQPWTCGNV